MTDETLAFDGEEMKPLAQHMPDAPIAPAHGIAAIALSMAMKYCDITTVQDGALYQQYKLEGRNFRGLDLNAVFEIAIQIEHHLMASNERVAGFVIDAIKDAVIEVGDDEHPNSEAAPDTSP